MDKENIKSNRRRDFLNALAPKVNFPSISRKKSMESGATLVPNARRDSVGQIHRHPVDGTIVKDASETILNSNANFGVNKPDITLFAHAEYRPEYYLRGAIIDDSEENVANVSRQLFLLHEQQGNELKKVVYKNYNDFLQVGDALVGFGGVLHELRQIEAQFKITTNTLINSAGLGPMVTISTLQSCDAPEPTGMASALSSNLVSPTPSAPFSPGSVASPADWENRRQKMAALCDLISDFSKYITPNRYLLLEGGSITEHTSTGNPKPVTLFLFNDAVITASKRSRLGLSTSGKKLSLDHFWPLSECSISDISDSSSVKNAFRISRDDESSVLVAESGSSKRLWLQQLLQAQKLLNAPSAPAPEAFFGKDPDTASIRSLGIPSRNAASPLKRQAGSPRPDSPANKSILGTPRMRTATAGSISKFTMAPTLNAIEVPEEVLKKVANILDNLDEYIATSQYDAAVEMVDQAKYELNQFDQKSPSLTRLYIQLNKQVEKLASYLYHEISLVTISRDAMSRHIQRLVVLGLAREAREKFLASRSELIRDKMRQVKFIGDLVKVVRDVSFATFNVISSSADWYVSSFKDNFLMAGFVFWTRIEITNLVNIISKLIFKPSPLIGNSTGTNGKLPQTVNITSSSQSISDDASALPDFSLIGECLATVRRHCASLTKIGLDMFFFLDDLLLPRLQECIHEYQSQLEGRLKSAIEEDSFQEVKTDSTEGLFTMTGSILTKMAFYLGGATKSAVVFGDFATQFLNSLQPIMIDSFGELVVGRIASFVELFATSLIQASYPSDLSILAFLGIVTNMNYLRSSLLPIVKEQVEGIFRRTFADLNKLSARLNAAVETLYVDFATVIIEKLLPEDFSSYSRDGNIPDTADASDWVLNMLPMLAKISRDTPASSRQQLIGQILLTVLTKLQSVQVIFGSFGIQQFLLDINFIISSGDVFFTEEIGNLASQICGGALKRYKKNALKAQESGEDNIIRLRDRSWYDERTSILISHYRFDFGVRGL